MAKLSPKERRQQAESPISTVKVLESLCRDKNSAVRYLLACNRSVPANVLKILAVDLDWSVRYAVASNSITPLGILADLCNDLNPKVRRVAGCNITENR